MFVFSMACALANEPTRRMSRDPEALSIIQVVTEQADLIEYFNDGKLYLKAENICHTNVGLALYNGGSTILLPRLSVDQWGYYLNCRREDTLTCSNSNCGYQWSLLEHASGYCPRCGWAGE